MLNIKQGAFSLCFMLLIMIINMHSMDPVINLREADIQIHSDNQLCFLGDKEYENLDAMGVPRSSLASSMPAIKIDCFAQIMGQEFDWTAGELPDETEFPPYMPLSLVWGLKTNDSVSFVNEDGNGIKLYLRENFDVCSSCENPSAQIEKAMEKFIEKPTVYERKSAYQQYELTSELISKGLVKQVWNQKEGKFVTLHNTGLADRDIFEYLLNKPKSDKELQQNIKLSSTNENARKKVLASQFSDSQNMVHLLRNREIGKK